ncbi:MFS transporter [Myxacorys almedinensis]|uniref:MFS transporter n=1 Tax=Myxacorys almedinensis A TaxID=2690445 RepID=A0A8J8CN32_9CYAN|nr:MFS transporter [Myxacorys almedinensis]NDJ17987.1 MFS transporter [Myxacorys almedinensis A]
MIEPTANHPQLLSRNSPFRIIGLTVWMVSYNLGVLPAIMPAIVRDFDSSIGSIQTVLVLFSLTTAAFAPTTENLCRYFGRTPVFLAGLLLYGIGISLTALSPSIAILAISFAVLTGLAATPLVSTPWTFVDLIYRGKTEEQATVGLIVVSTLGSLMGSLLGGFLASRIGWRWAFVPSLVALIGIWFRRRSLPNLSLYCEQPIDWVGGLLSCLGLGSILSGVSLAMEFGWWEPKRAFSIGGVVLPPFPLSIVPPLIAVGLILLGFFGFWQRRQARKGEASILRAGLLRQPGFVLGMLAAMLHTLIIAGVQFNLFQYVPLALALDPYQTALTIMPLNITKILVVIGSLKLLRLGSNRNGATRFQRLSPKSIVFIGLALLAIGILMLYRSLTLQVSSINLLPGLLVMGIGSGLFSPYVSRLTYSTAENGRVEGTGIYNPAQNLGSSLGKAILGTALIFYASRDIVDGVLQQIGQTVTPANRVRLIATLQEMIQTMSRQEVSAEIVNQVPPSVVPFLRQISQEATTSGLRTSLLLALLLTGLCFLLATTLPKYPSRPAEENA